MPEALIAPMATDDELVRFARQGDPSAREELFRRHWFDAYRVAFRLLGNEQDAQDATQECMIKALGHLGDFDGRSSFKTWLFTIVKNSAYDAGRRRKRRKTLGLGPLDGGKRWSRTGSGERPGTEPETARSSRRP